MDAGHTNLTHPELGPPDELSHGDFELVVRRLADDLAFGTDASRFVGSGLEYAQSRPYAPVIRSVKSTGKSQRAQAERG